MSAATQYAMQRYPTPPPRTRAVRLRMKMEQRLEKAGAKAEAILTKLMQSGKLLPGSLDKVGVCPPNYGGLPRPQLWFCY